jgi:hypothetical protein
MDACIAAEQMGEHVAKVAAEVIAKTMCGEEYEDGKASGPTPPFAEASIKVLIPKLTNSIAEARLASGACLLLRDCP